MDRFDQTLPEHGSLPAGQPQAEMRLSHLAMWEQQRRYFEEQGIRAWSEGQVPYAITNSPWIASAYARIVAAWLRDCLAAELLDLSQPLYLQEIGAGNGRFGYLFLRQLLESLDTWSCPAPAIRYLYTDVSEYNLDVLRSHPSLQPLIAEGLVDFAVYDVLESDDVLLTQSGDVLRPGECSNPAVVLANYIFDGLPADCFRLTAAGDFEEGLVRTHPPDASMRQPRPLAEDDLDFHYRPLLPPAYPKASWNAVLESYRSLPAGSTVLFPVGALTCTDRLRRLWNRGFLLLSSDKGFSQPEELAQQGDPLLSRHGSFSFLVNYHALGVAATARGDQWLASTHQETCLATVALLHRPSQGSFDQTRQAFQDWIEAHGPDDFFILRRLLLSNIDRFTLEQFLAVLRFSGWDHTIVLAGKRRLQALLRVAEQRERNLVSQALHSVWDHYFPLREREDLAVCLSELRILAEASSPVESL